MDLLPQLSRERDHQRRPAGNPGHRLHGDLCGAALSRTSPWRVTCHGGGLRGLRGQCLAWACPPHLRLLAGFLVAGLVGLVSDEVALRPLRGPTEPSPPPSPPSPSPSCWRTWCGSASATSLRGYDLPLVRDWRVWGIRVGPQQVQNLVMALIIMAVVFAAIEIHASVGKAMRAVADNPTLAELKGIDPVLGRSDHGLRGDGPCRARGGCSWAWAPRLTRSPGSASFCRSSRRRWSAAWAAIPGAALGAMVVGIGEELSVLVLSPSYKSAVGFIAIVLVLAVRPRGLSGREGLLMLSYLLATHVHSSESTRCWRWD